MFDNNSDNNNNNVILQQCINDQASTGPRTDKAVWDNVNNVTK